MANDPLLGMEEYDDVIDSGGIYNQWGECSLPPSISPAAVLLVGGAKSPIGIIDGHNNSGIGRQ